MAVRDAREIGLARDPRAEPDVQRLVPDVELPKVGRVHGRDEVDGVRVSHVHDVFIGADAVEPGHLIVRQVARFHRQSPARVGEAYNCALRLAPAQNRQVPGGPVLDAFRAGIVLLGQPQQHQVAGVAGRESRNLEVVVHEFIALRERMVLAAEELLLVVVARTPGEHASHVEFLSQDLAHHVLGPDALGGVLVMRAAGGVDVVVA